MIDIIPNGTKVLVHTDQGIKKATIFDVHMGNFSQKGLSYWVKEWQGRVPAGAIEIQAQGESNGIKQITEKAVQAQKQTDNN